MTTVDIVYTKYDGRPHKRTTGRLLGTDEHGTWLGSPTGTASEYLSSGAVVPGPVPFLRLIPPDAWWTALFPGGDVEPLVYCDITAPASWPAPDRVTLVDLDLDVEQMRDGVTTLLDEDEFAEHRGKYGYPPEVIAAATAAAQFLMTAITEAHEPFATAYRPWLAGI